MIGIVSIWCNLNGNSKCFNVLNKNGVRIGVFFWDFVIYKLKLLILVCMFGYIIVRINVIIVDYKIMINGIKCFLLKKDKVFGNFL